MLYTNRQGFQIALTLYTQRSNHQMLLVRFELKEGNFDEIHMRIALMINSKYNYAHTHRVTIQLHNYILYMYSTFNHYAIDGLGENCCHVQL